MCYFVLQSILLKDMELRLNLYIYHSESCWGVEVEHVDCLDLNAKEHPFSQLPTLPQTQRLSSGGSGLDSMWAGGGSSANLLQ